MQTQRHNDFMPILMVMLMMGDGRQKNNLLPLLMIMMMQPQRPQPRHHHQAHALATES